MELKVEAVLIISLCNFTGAMMLTHFPKKLNDANVSLASLAATVML